MCNETVERVQLIYNVVYEQFRIEWQLTGDLDQKASNIIGFVGIMVSLLLGLGTPRLMESVTSNNIYFNSNIFFVLGIFSLLCSIFCSLIAYYTREWDIGLDTEYFIKEYGEKGIDSINILKNLSKKINKSLIDVKDKNDNKVKFINYSFIFLIIGIFMVAISFFGSLI